MGNILSKLGITFLSKKLNGKKTYLSGDVLIFLDLAGIGTASASIIGQLSPDVGAPDMDMDTCLAGLQEGGAMFAAGLATIGLGHKVEKTAINLEGMRGGDDQQHNGIC